MPFLRIYACGALAFFWLAAFSLQAAELKITIEELSKDTRSMAIRLNLLDGTEENLEVEDVTAWTSKQWIPNPKQLSGDKFIIATKEKSKIIPVDTSWWPAGKYTIYASAFYRPAPEQQRKMLTASAELEVLEKTPSTSLSIPLPEKIDIGTTLTLSLSMAKIPDSYSFIKAELISAGQQVRNNFLPLEDSEECVASWDNDQSSVSVDTSKWRPQILNCLFVRATFKERETAATVLVERPLPSIAVGVTPIFPPEIKSYRGDRVIHLVTQDQSGNTIGYPTCTSWRSNEELIIESNRLADEKAPGAEERQLMLVNIFTGKATFLAALKSEGDSILHKRLRVSSQFHFDYSRKLDRLVFYDMTGRRLYTVTPGKQPVEIWHETNGIIGDPPAISHDGTRVLFYVVEEGPISSPIFLGKTSKIYTIDLDPSTGEAIDEPQLRYTFPWLRSTARGKQSKATISLNHVQFDPTNKDNILFAHDGAYIRDGSPEASRIWKLALDGSSPIPIAPAGELGSYYYHEVYGSSGEYVYTVLRSSIGRISLAENIYKNLFIEGPVLQAQHIAVSQNEKWIAADISSGLGRDNAGNPIGGLFLLEVASGRVTFLAAFPAGWSHPRHVHPSFSPDGTKIAFTVADGPEHSQVAYIDISDIVSDPSLK